MIVRRKTVVMSYSGMSMTRMTSSTERQLENDGGFTSLSTYAINDFRISTVPPKSVFKHALSGRRSLRAES